MALEIQILVSKDRGRYKTKNEFFSVPLDPSHFPIIRSPLNVGLYVQFLHLYLTESYW